jgi:hypothetical protein
MVIGRRDYIMKGNKGVSAAPKQWIIFQWRYAFNPAQFMQAVWMLSRRDTFRGN